MITFDLLIYMEFILFPDIRESSICKGDSENNVKNYKKTWTVSSLVFQPCHLCPTKLKFVVKHLDIRLHLRWYTTGRTRVRRPCTLMGDFSFDSSLVDYLIPVLSVVLEFSVFLRNPSFQK